VRLADELSRAGISLNLQGLEEAFGLTVLEAMRAGCVVLASPVGAYQEIVRHGQNGFLVPGDHREEATWRRAADLVAHLAKSPEHVRYVRHNAMAVPWNWETMASTWSGHWNWALGQAKGPNKLLTSLALACAECGGEYLPLADGYHCTACGFYSQGP
jgi:glycosyltransferase involved in cell wall biosynthesis